MTAQQRQAAMTARGERPMRSRGRGGAQLRDERVAADVEQQALADALGIPRQMLGYLEAEYTRLPRAFAAEYRAALTRLAR